MKLRSSSNILGKRSIEIKSRIIISLLFCAMLMCDVAQATTYYVDSVSGSNSNSGTSPEEAWASLTKVNLQTFGAGDQVLFKAGTVYTGQLKPKGSGSSGSPVIIDMYGIGVKPRIDGQGTVNPTLLLENIEYYEVNNLEITNTGPTRVAGRIGVGVWVWSGSLPVAHHIHLKNLYVHDVNGSNVKADGGGTGINVYCYGANSRLDDLLIENCHLVRTDRNGIGFWNDWYEPAGDWNPGTNVVIRGNLLEDIGGDGIVPIGCDGALVEYNKLDGGRTRAQDFAGGMWPWGCTDTVFQFNEVTGMVGTNDGMAYNCDWECSGTIFQYNYSHDNDGGFIMACSVLDSVCACRDSIVRYNVSQNDGSDSRIITLSGKIINTKIYNNVIYSNLDNNLIELGNWDGGVPTDTHFYNNIFYITGQASYVWGTATGTVFENNVFYGNHNSPPSDAYAITSNPLLIAPGSGGDGLDSVYGYMLQAGSPALDSGQIVSGNGGWDYWRNPLYDGSPDRGAHEYAYGTDTDPPVPNPVEWLWPPYATGEDTIKMSAKPLADQSSVEYNFTCTSGPGNDSGWQDSTAYKDTGLTPGTTYAYLVTARDKSAAQNTTTASSVQSATTYILETTPPSPSPMTWATAPFATGDTSIKMIATTAADPAGVKYYFTCTSGGGYDSGWQDSPVSEDVGLSPATTYTYTVIARDKGSNLNTGSVSGEQSATTNTSGSSLVVNPNFELEDPCTVNLTPRQIATGGTVYNWNGWQGSEWVNTSDHPTALMQGEPHSGSIWQNSTIICEADTVYTFLADIKSLSGSGASCKLECEKIPGWDSDLETYCYPPASGWQEFSHVLNTASYPVYVGNTLSFGIRPASGSVAFTNFRITVSGDVDPPSPSTMTWASVPTATGSTSISMTATTATDTNGVQYYFKNITVPYHNSGWQDSTTYVDIGLEAETTYTYTVTARDKSSGHNTTSASSAESATTNPAYNLDDLTYMAAVWLTSDGQWDIAPIPSGDGIINYEDFGLLWLYWNPAGL